MISQGISNPDAALIPCAALAPSGAFYSHRSRAPLGCVSPVVSLPFSTVEIAPVASAQPGDRGTLSAGA
jgi:hypothetical protein